MTVRIVVGDVRERLSELPDGSVHCVVTSPPYWGLRDYGVAGQIGLEPTVVEHVETVVTVFREVHRVLRVDGTVWLNYGDCYATGAGKVGKHPGGGAQGERWRGNQGAGNQPSAKPGRGIGPLVQPNRMPQEGLKPKDLVLMPARIALALQSDGWWVRSEIVWAKPNPMPESVRDRPTSAHEKVFLLTKSARYFYDAHAVREPAKGVSPRHRSTRDEPASPAGGVSKRTGRRRGKPTVKTYKQRGHSRRHAGFNERWEHKTKTGQQAMGANLRNVWTIAPRPYRDAHFATFPPALVEPCIKAGTSERGCCPECGTPLLRVAAERGRRTPDASDFSPAGEMQDIQANVDWESDCECCAVDPVACTVLDPFAGAGTVGLVANRLGRDAILIELNPAYAQMARKRIEGDAPMFTRVGLEDAI